MTIKRQDINQTFFLEGDFIDVQVLCTLSMDFGI